MSTSGVLCCGLVCVDTVTIVDSFPQEDSLNASLDQYKARGGNASNSCTVLAELGFPCSFFGSLGMSSLETEFIMDDFRKFGIDFEQSPQHTDKFCSHAVIIVSKETASRTIVNTNKGLPELSLEDFKKLDLTKYSWIHLEGRNNKDLVDIMKYLQKNYKGRFSVEVEKVNRGHEEYIPYGDVVFISKDVSRNHGCQNMEEAVTFFKEKIKPGAELVVPWGECGAAFWSEGRVSTCRAYPPPTGVVDTLGAGDTFNAVVIGLLSQGRALKECVDTACKVAGVKVGRKGFQGLGKVIRDLGIL